MSRKFDPALCGAFLAVSVADRGLFLGAVKELSSALVDRDRAICERNELLEKYCHEVKDKAEAQKELNQACKDIETVKEERDVARKERTEAIIQRDQLLREYYQARQVSLCPLRVQPRDRYDALFVCLYCYTVLSVYSPGNFTFSS